MGLKIGIPKEIHSGEKRMVATLETVVWLQKLGFEVALESGAGEHAHFSDDLYREDNGIYRSG